MNWDQIKGQWKQLKGSAQRTWGEITGDEWDQFEGDREKLSGKIQERYGRTKDEAEREIHDWSRGL
ncbi:CsbD family protein [Leisingera aquaemixtae]|uniref:CsbD family protein n=1 Tax=Leisingera aquaemixtae TaxID=1396826 RepID=UPI0021A30509|nr:CsbD family protein [Leisingera aquaemixtae]UWQ44978.1 CsbD family protein [Leisingera aquaemixtae]